MPIIKSAKKKMRQDERRYAQNLRTKRALHNAAKAFMAKPTFDGLKDVQSKIDTAVKKGVLKPNTGARRMIRMSRIAKAAGVKIPAKKPVAKTVQKPAIKVAKKSVTKTTAKKPATKATTKTAKKSTAKA